MRFLTNLPLNTFNQLLIFPAQIGVTDSVYCKQFDLLPIFKAHNFCKNYSYKKRRL